jgi:hypothetical protein
MRMPRRVGRVSPSSAITGRTAELSARAIRNRSGSAVTRLGRGQSSDDAGSGVTVRESCSQRPLISKMLPLGPLNHAICTGPAWWMSPLRVAPGRLSYCWKVLTPAALRSSTALVTSSTIQAAVVALFELASFDLQTMSWLVPVRYWINLGSCRTLARCSFRLAKVAGCVEVVDGDQRRHVGVG